MSLKESLRSLDGLFETITEEELVEFYIVSNVYFDEVIAKNSEMLERFSCKTTKEFHDEIDSCFKRVARYLEDKNAHPLESREKEFIDGDEGDFIFFTLILDNIRENYAQIKNAVRIEKIPFYQQRMESLWQKRKITQERLNERLIEMVLTNDVTDLTKITKIATFLLPYFLQLENLPRKLRLLHRSDEIGEKIDEYFDKSIDAFSSNNPDKFTEVLTEPLDEISQSFLMYVFGVSKVWKDVYEKMKSNGTWEKIDPDGDVDCDFEAIMQLIREFL